jgi:hypothetical protein
VFLESNSFRMTCASYLAYIHHYNFAKTWGFRIATFCSLALVIGFSAWTYLRQNIEVATAGLAAAAALVLWYICLLFVFPVLGFFSAKKRGTYGRDCKVYIDATHIWTIDAANEIRKPWNSIDNVVEARNHIFVYFDKCNAFIIPKTAFDSLKDADVFFQAAKTLFDSAKFIKNN